MHRSRVRLARSRRALEGTSLSTPSTVRQVSTATSRSKNDPTRGAKVCAVLGAQWGDEGKGKLADVLARDFDVIARFNGGNNAGHTVVVNGKRHAFHLLPCGALYPHTTNILGNGTVVHLPALFEEMRENDLDLAGRLKISSRAHLLFDFHQAVDGALEKSRGTGSIGTTKKGIGPCYTSKAMRNSVRAAQLVGDWIDFRNAYDALADAHERQFQINVSRTAELDALKTLRERLLRDNMVVDTTVLVHEALGRGKRVLCEGANAVMLDLDHGTYPFVTSSSTSAGGVCTGLGLPPSAVDSAVGVVKAYTTRVGAGPFPTELTDDTCGGMVPRGAPGTEVGRLMQTVGAEIGVTTGRKRRCGWLDVVVLQYSHMINGYTSLNITKLDVLNDLDELKLGVAYELDGKTLPRGAVPALLKDLARVKVVYESMPGWKCSLAQARTYDDLPPAAKRYLNRIEQLVGVPIVWVGTGQGREQMLVKS